MKLIEENKLWAGLVFVDFPEDSDSDELPEVCSFVTQDPEKVLGKIILPLYNLCR